MYQALIIILYLSFFSFTNGQNYKQVKVQLNNSEELQSIYELGMDLDHIHLEKDLSVTFFIEENDFQKLKISSLNYEILIDDWKKYYSERSKMSDSERTIQLSKSASRYGVTDFDYGSMGGYYTLDEVIAQLDYLYSAYGSIITEKESIGTTFEGREIYVVKISDNPNIDEEEPEVLYTSLHHSREPESMMQMIYYMYYLLENYGIDDEVTYLVNNREMYFIPVVNPDGYAYNETIAPGGGGMWRKNRRINEDGSEGVDLNRNYGPYEYWNASNGGSSLNGGSNTYRGTEPFSEPETAAIRDFLISHDIKNCLNYHTYGNLLIYPYGALEVESADSLKFREFARDMTQYNHYTYGTDQQTVGYSTRGNSDDYMYDGEMDKKGKIFAMTPEVGRTFWPEESLIIPLAEENVFPNLYYAWVAGGYASPSRIVLSQDIIEQGDTVTVSVDLKNKGLSEFNHASMTLSENLDLVNIIKDYEEISKLSPDQTKSIESAFQFIVDDELESGTEIFFAIDFYTEGVHCFSEELSIVVGTPIVIFSDSSDALDENWNSKTDVPSRWTETMTDYHSAPAAFTDSQFGNYWSNSKVELELKEFIDLSGLNEPKLSFWTKFEIEQGWDYAQVQVMSDLDSIWNPAGGNYSVSGAGGFQPEGEPVYSGNQYNWVKEIIDLTDYIDQKIKLKFILHTDQYVEMDGWYVDDIQVYEYSELFTGTNEEYSTWPASYSLNQNYPNPFNPSTVIEYSIPAAENGNSGFNQTRLVVFDMLGRKITTLVNKVQSAGQYSVTFDAAGLASGVYYYRLQSGSFSSVRKMILLQ